MKKRVKKILPFALAVALIGGGVLAASTSVFASSSNNPTITQESQENLAAELAKLQKEAKLTKEESVAIATKDYPGTVKGVELEDENGVAVYNVQLENNKQLTEVKVDAKSGAITKIEAGDNEKADKEKEDNEQGGKENHDSVEQ